MSPNPVDILLAGFVLVPALIGLWRGMLWPISVVVGLVGGAVAAVTFGPTVASALLPGSAWAPLAVAAMVFVVVFAFVQMARWMLRRALAALKLKWVDHMAGAMLSAATGAVTGAWIITAVALFHPERPAVYEGSLLVDHAETLACGTGLPCDEGVALPALEGGGLPDLRSLLEGFPGPAGQLLPPGAAGEDEGPAD